MEEIDLINGLAQVVREKQGEHLTVIDISGFTTTTKYSVILTVNSKVHAESMTKNLIDYLIANGYREYLLSKNVQTNNPWILIDASDIIIHIFEKEVRDFYNLEKLYTRGKIIISE
jgi:ribosome-associated protein